MTSRAVEATGGSGAPEGKPAEVTSEKVCSQRNQKDTQKQQKQESQDKTTKAPKQKKKAAQPTPCPRIMKLLEYTLADCKESHCVHPKFAPVKMDSKQFQLSVYWSRNAVGVKVLKSALPGGKQKKNKQGGTKWSQVAYFGCKTSCVYSNIVLAHEYVP